MGLAGTFQVFRAKGRAVSVDGGPTDERRLPLERESVERGGLLEDAQRRTGDLRPDTVAGEDR